MLQLLLLRHAKSSWSGDGLTDLDRPLNRRGERAASAMGRFMASKRLVPDLVLCSPARRARDTLELVAAKFDTPPPTLIDDRIYDFGSGKNLLECIRQQATGIKSLLLVGHNPSIEGLAQSLSARGEERPRSRLKNKYPTCALAVITMNVPDWSAVCEKSGTLVRFVRPRDITAVADD